jgi:hypothetical protein
MTTSLACACCENLERATSLGMIQMRNGTVTKAKIAYAAPMTARFCGSVNEDRSAKYAA